MREIKFRSWDKEAERMVLQGENGNEYVWMIGTEDMFIQHITESNIPEQVLMQSTGVKDKNGVEIYEKDYVRFGGIVALVTWSDKYCQFRLDDGTATISLNIHHKSDYEVIGNVYENPELLEVSK